MNVLLTGGSGFLGTHIKEVLQAFNLTELNRNQGDIRCDLAKEVPVIENSYDLVIHTAGKAHVIPTSEEEKNEFYSVNVNGTKNLLTAFDNSSCIPKYFVFISTVAVYGRTEGNNIPEDAELLAKDPYGLSKIMAESVLQEWCKMRNVVLTIIRPPLIVGDNATGNLRDLVNAIRKGYYFNIDGGKAQKSMVLATDIAQFILLAYQNGGVFVLTDGYHPTFFELSSIISKSIGKGYPRNMPLIIAKLLAVFGNVLGSKAPLNSSKLKKILSTLTFSDSNARNAYNWQPSSVLNYLSHQRLEV